MALPKKFELNNFTYDITPLTQDQIDKIMINVGKPGSFCGFFDNKNMTVGYLNKLPAQHKPRTILHELMHACIHDCDHISSRDQEENIVLHLEERVTDLIKNNPKLINYLQENL